MRPRREEISELNLARRGVPKNFIGKTIDDFKDYEIESLSNLKEYLEDYLTNIDLRFIANEGMFLYGANGNGKTLISAIIVSEAYWCRYTSKRVYFQEYITEYTKVWGAKDSDERAEMLEVFYNDYKGVEFLVLDEIGKEINTKVGIPILDDCLRYREDKGLVTIICTNLDPNSFSEKYGGSISSLVKGNMTPIKIVGSDKRKDEYIGRKNAGE